MNRPLRVARWATLLVAALVTLAAAQGTPTVSVDAYTLDQGDAVTLTARGLQPSAVYRVSFVPPPGSTGAASEQDATASTFGNLVRSARLDIPGTWTVSLVGPGMDAQLRVSVAADPALAHDAEVAEDAPATPQAQDGAARGTGQDDAQDSGQATADQDAEEAAQEGTGTPAQDALDAAGTPAQTAAPAAEPVPGSVPSASIVDDAVVGALGGRQVWRLGFGPDSGGTSGLLQRGDQVLVGHGNHVLVVDATTGVVARRFRLPARVANIEQSVDTVEVVVVGADGSAQRLPFSPETGVGTTVFYPVPELYGWLRAEAQVADPDAALADDPTNPWLYIEAARLSDADRAQVLKRGALARAQTFYEYAQLANEFMQPANRTTELANQAMEAALDDFTSRGYRASLLFDEDASRWYGFPLGALRSALTRGDDEAADFWAPLLYRLANDQVPAMSAALADYARALRAAGRADEARVWTERATEGQRFTLSTALRRTADAVGRTGWYGVGALLLAILALHLTLSAKYWRAQSLVIGQRRESGRTVGRFARLFTMRYATFTEKVVVILLFAAVLAQAALSGWVQRTDAMPAHLGTGTLATPAAQELLRVGFPDTPGTRFALGFAAQSSGDVDTASVRYRELTDDADAMNNLGVIRDDPELYRLALELQPGHPAATFNLGLGPNPSRLLAAYLPDQPVLATPGRDRLAVALAGDYGSALGAAFTNPWTSLVEVRAVRPQWLWIGLVALFLAWVAFSVVTLFVPRPAPARNAPRTFLYHLLALLLPGSGLADELWGVLLVVPWAIFGIDLALHYLPTQAATSFSIQTDTIVLVVIYAINTVAFVVEYLSYRRRMRTLRSEQPAVAAAYGMRGR